MSLLFKPTAVGYRFFVPAIALLGCLAPLSTFAANGSWLSGQIGSQLWSNSANWTSGTIPGSAILNSDIATFGSNTGATQISIDAGRTIGSLLFNGTNTAGLYTLGESTANTGSTLRLTSGGNITQAPGTLTVTTINAPLVIEPSSNTSAGSYTITNNATNVASDPNPNKLNLAGDISGGVTTLGITLNLTGTTGNRSSNTSANIVSGLISNGGAAGGLSVTSTGSAAGERGAWSLTNNSNSYTGNTTITNGTLIFTSIANAGVNSAIGAGNTLFINGGAHAKYAGPAASTDRTIVAAGTLYSQGSGSLTLNGPVQLPGTLTFRGSQPIIINSVISGVGGLSRTDNTVVTLNNTNTFEGNVNAADGAFRVASIGNQGVASPLGAGSIISFGQNSTTVGRIEFTGANGGSTNREIRLNSTATAGSGNGRFDNTVAGQTLTLSGRVLSASTTASHFSSLNLTGVGNGVVSGVIGGTIAVATAPINLTLIKDGTGTWALSNSNLYYGNTNINAGTLLVTNTSGSATGTGNVITSGSGGLGGTGFVTANEGGSITIASGTRLLIGTTHGSLAGSAGPVGTTSGPSQLSLGSAQGVALTLAGTLQWDLFGSSDGVTSGSSDRLLLKTTASSIALGGVVTVADSSGIHAPWRTGTWQLIDWTQASSATATGSFTYNLPTTLASGYTWNTDNLLTTGSLSIQKTAANHTWTGTDGTSWNTASNWEIGTVPTGNDDVFFGDASANLTHSVDGDKSVRNLFFTGEKNHVINNTSGVLYAQGHALEVSGGTQRLGTAQLRIRGTTGRFDIINQGNLTFNTMIMYHRASGSGDLNLVFSGAGDTILNHVQRRVDSYDVSYTVNGPGTLTFTSYTDTLATGSAGSTTGTTTVTGGKLRLNDERNLGTNPAAFNAAHLLLNGGALQAYASVTFDDVNRGITVGSIGTTLEVDASHHLTLTSPLTGTGTIVKTGPGRLVLNNAGTHTGAMQVNTGALQIGTGGAGSSGTGPVTLGTGTHLTGSGTLQTAQLTLQSGATLQAGDITTGTTTGNGTLTFTPTSTGTYQIDSGSSILLGLTTATNQLSIDPTFGGTLQGSPEYQAYIDGVTGSGDHDRLVFNGGTGSLLTLNGSLTVTSNGLVPQPGQIFNLLDWGLLLTTDFSNFDPGLQRNGADDDTSDFNLPDISSSGYFWDVSRFTTTGNIAIVVPEPSRGLLLILGLTLGFARRRRK